MVIHRQGRPGMVVFLGGIACLMTAAGLGSYLAFEARAGVTRTEFNQYLSHDARMDEVHIREDPDLLASVNALMWMIFGLGACLSLIGARMIARPPLNFEPQPPIRLIGEIVPKPK